MVDTTQQGFAQIQQAQQAPQVPSQTPQGFAQIQRAQQAQQAPQAGQGGFAQIQRAQQAEVPYNARWRNRPQSEFE